MRREFGRKRLIYISENEGPARFGGQIRENSLYFPDYQGIWLQRRVRRRLLPPPILLSGPYVNCPRHGGHLDTIPALGDIPACHRACLGCDHHRAHFPGLSSHSSVLFSASLLGRPPLCCTSSVLPSARTTRMAARLPESHPRHPTEGPISQPAANRGFAARASRSARRIGR
jgi:hypothetical protein